LRAVAAGGAEARIRFSYRSADVEPAVCRAVAFIVRHRADLPSRAPRPRGEPESAGHRLATGAPR